MSTGFAHLIRSLTCLAISIATAHVHAKPISEITNATRPRHAEILGDLSYLPEVVHKLRDPGLVYVDLDWFIERGYDVPRTLTPATERKILDALAWAGRVEGESERAYTQETKTFFSDYYGGEAIGNHRGGGRTGSLGEIQIKGLHRTKMVHHTELADEGHSSGTATLIEGIQEVLRSQIAHRESPFGANRVIALITTGTWVDKRGDRQMRVLIVREDPLRPAHFVVNIASAKLEREKNRMKYVITNIDRALPLPAGAALERKADRIETGVREYIERTAKVSAYHYANQLFHSAYSVSNTEISGAALDFGALIGLEGYPNAGRPADGELNGNILAQKNVIKEFIQSLRDQLPEELRSRVPLAREAVKILERSFAKHLRFELNVLTGMPPELLRKLQSEAVSRELAKVIMEISRHGHGDPVNALKVMIPRSGTYDLNEILLKMGSAFNVSGESFDSKDFAEKLDSVLRSEIVDDAIRRRLISSYGRMLALVIDAAKAEGIALSSLQRYVALAADIRNRKNPHLLSNEPNLDFWQEAAARFERDRDPKPLRKALQDAIEKGRRNFRDAEPYTIVLSETRVASGKFIRDVFDLRTGKMKKVPFNVARVGSALRFSCAIIFRGTR